jgi:hypothetical protein
MDIESKCEAIEQRDRCKLLPVCQRLFDREMQIAPHHKQATLIEDAAAGQGRGCCWRWATLPLYVVAGRDFKVETE